MNPFRVRGASNSLWNEELAPIDADARRAGLASLAIVWAANGCSLPVYLLVAGLLAEGISRSQTLIALTLGSLVVLACAVANGHAGARYGIPFSVAARASFGVVGAKLAVGLRALVACGWLGILSWVGAKTLFAMVRIAIPSLPTSGVWIGFAVFLGLSTVGPRWLQQRGIAAVVLAGVFIALLVSGHGRPAAEMVHQEPGSFLLALTAASGLWAWSALGAANYARNAQGNRQHIAGAIALPLGAIFVTTLMTARPGTGLWNPGMGTVDSVAPGMALALLAALSLALWSEAGSWHESVVAELVGIAPETIARPTASVLACLVAVAFGPWRLIGDVHRYVADWLVGCSGLLSPVAAVMLVEYFALRRQWLNVDDLYQRDGLYEYTDGWNWRAVAAVTAAWCAVLSGLWVPALRVLYEGAGFTGFAVAGAMYWLLRSGPPDVAQIPPTPLLIPLAGFESEGASG